VAGNNLGEPVDVDAYLAVFFVTESGTGFLYYDGITFVLARVPFVSNVRLDRGFFLPRTKVLEYSPREGLAPGGYAFTVGLMYAGTDSLACEPNSATVFVKE